MDDIKRDINISGRVTIHDAYQFEIKLEYNLEELLKSNNYKIEVFIFIPKSLQINKNTYPPQQFYSDLQNYIRFKTPSFSFKLILDPEFKKSPLYVLRQLFLEFSKAKSHKEKVRLVHQCIKELKLLGVMVKARLRDFGFFTKTRLEKGDREEAYILKRVENTIERGIEILHKLREIKKDFLNNYPEEKELFKYFGVVEEFISHLLEEELVGLLKYLDNKIQDKNCLEKLKSKFMEFCKREKEYRKEEGFHLKFEEGEKAKEQYIYYRSQYKKIIASVLYLDIVREKKDTAYTHIIGATAAFSASVIYLALSQYINSMAVNTLPLIVFVSLIYVFKDRIKDLIKLMLNPKVLSFFPDHVTKIKDTSEEKPVVLGDIREKVFFTSRKNIDPQVLALRDKTKPAAFLPEESPEEILVYQKEIEIDTSAIRERHTRTVNLTDIMRFNIHRYLEKMDDPEQPINYFDEKEGRLSTSIGGRTYHINLILKYSQFKKGEEQIRYERYRIVANKWGILRVEKVE